MIQSVLTVEEERCQNKCYAASMILFFLFLTVRPKNDYISAISLGNSNTSFFMGFTM